MLNQKSFPDTDMSLKLGQGQHIEMELLISVFQVQSQSYQTSIHQQLFVLTSVYDGFVSSIYP